MHYVRIAIAVAVWVSIWTASQKDWDEFGEGLKGFSRILFLLCIILLILGAIWGFIYLCYRWLKAINWGAVWELIWAIGMFIGIAIVINLPFLIIVWLSDKLKKK